MRISCFIPLNMQLKLIIQSYSWYDAMTMNILQFRGDGLDRVHNYQFMERSICSSTLANFNWTKEKMTTL